MHRRTLFCLSLIATAVIALTLGLMPTLGLWSGIGAGFMYRYVMGELNV